MISTKHATHRAWACSVIWDRTMAQSLHLGQGWDRHKLGPGTKAPSTAGDAESRLVWGPQAVLPHPSLSGSSSSTRFCSPYTPVSLMSHWFPTIFHSLWSLLSTRTAPLQPGFETLLKLLSQPYFAIPRVKKMWEAKVFQTAAWLPVIKDSAQKGRKTARNTILPCEKSSQTSWILIIL